MATENVLGETRARATQATWAVAVCLLAALALSGCGPTATIQDLGSLGGQSFGHGINAAGNVTGGSYLGAGGHDGMHAFRYVDGLGMIDLGTLAGNVSVGEAINSGARIAGAGFADVPGDLISHAFVVSGGTLVLTDLGTLGGDYSYAWDINDNGQITGAAANRAGQTHAFLRTSPGDLRDLGTLGGDWSEGQSINQSGQVAGTSKIGAGYVARAFRFTEGAGMVSLGTLSGGTNSSGWGINDAGQVVGESDTAPILTPDVRRRGLPSLYGRHAFLWSEGQGMKDLGHLGGGVSIAYAINNNGVVVGQSTTGNGSARAVRWTEAQGMIDLNTLLPANSGWVLIEAADINDRGQITGAGFHNGVLRAFRLSPAGLVVSKAEPKASPQDERDARAARATYGRE